MIWRELTNKQFIRYRSKLISFLKQHGDRRITYTAIRWMKQATPADFDVPGTLVIAAMNGNMLIGLLVVARYGMEESMMAVHRDFRSRNIAKMLVDQAINKLGKVYGRVAIDNLSSLKACLASGMVAFHLMTGPTGKATLWLGGGDWQKEDVLREENDLSLDM